eukprot:gene1240-32585_t
MSQLSTSQQRTRCQVALSNGPVSLQLQNLTGQGGAQGQGTQTQQQQQQQQLQLQQQLSMQGLNPSLLSQLSQQPPHKPSIRSSPCCKASAAAANHSSIPPQPSSTQPASRCLQGGVPSNLGPLAPSPTGLFGSLFHSLSPQMGSQAYDTLSRMHDAASSPAPDVSNPDPGHNQPTHHIPPHQLQGSLFRGLSPHLGPQGYDNLSRMHDAASSPAPDISNPDPGSNQPTHHLPPHQLQGSLLRGMSPHLGPKGYDTLSRMHDAASSPAPDVSNPDPGHNQPTHHLPPHQLQGSLFRGMSPHLGPQGYDTLSRMHELSAASSPAPAISNADPGSRQGPEDVDEAGRPLKKQATDQSVGDLSSLLHGNGGGMPASLFELQALVNQQEQLSQHHGGGGGKSPHLSHPGGGGGGRASPLGVSGGFAAETLLGLDPARLNSLLSQAHGGNHDGGGGAAAAALGLDPARLNSLLSQAHGGNHDTGGGAAAAALGMDPARLSSLLSQAHGGSHDGGAGGGAAALGMDPARLSSLLSQAHGGSHDGGAGGGAAALGLDPARLNSLLSQAHGGNHDSGGGGAATALGLDPARLNSLLSQAHGGNHDGGGGGGGAAAALGMDPARLSSLLSQAHGGSHDGGGGATASGSAGGGGGNVESLQGLLQLFGNLTPQQQQQPSSILQAIGMANATQQPSLSSQLGAGMGSRTCNLRALDLTVAPEPQLETGARLPHVSSRQRLSTDGGSGVHTPDDSARLMAWWTPNSFPSWINFAYVATAGSAEAPL